MKTAIFLGVPLLAAILGALGGSQNSSKLFRRVGIPVLVIVAALAAGKYWYIASAVALFGTLSMGYGVDSAIRRIVKSDSATRFIYGALFGFAFWPCLFNEKWPLFGLHILATAFMFAMFGVLLKNEPVIKVGKLQLLVEDMIVYGVGTLFGVGLIYG